MKKTRSRFTKMIGLEVPVPYYDSSTGYPKVTPPPGFHYEGDKLVRNKRR